MFNVFKFWERHFQFWILSLFYILELKYNYITFPFLFLPSPLHWTSLSQIHGYGLFFSVVASCELNEQIMTICLSCVMLLYGYKFRSDHNSEFYTRQLIIQGQALYLHTHEAPSFSVYSRGPVGCSIPNSAGKSWRGRKCIWEKKTVKPQKRDGQSRVSPAIMESSRNSRTQPNPLVGFTSRLKLLRAQWAWMCWEKWEILCKKKWNGNKWKEKQSTTLGEIKSWGGNKKKKNLKVFTSWTPYTINLDPTKITEGHFNCLWFPCPTFNDV